MLLKHWLCSLTFAWFGLLHWLCQLRWFWLGLDQVGLHLVLCSQQCVYRRFSSDSKACHLSRFEVVEWFVGSFPRLAQLVFF